MHLRTELILLHSTTVVHAESAGCCSLCTDAGSVVPHLSGDVAKLAFAKVWSSLEVTFLYESFLLELRHIAFEGKSHLCEIAALHLSSSCTVSCVYTEYLHKGVALLRGWAAPSDCPVTKMHTEGLGASQSSSSYVWPVSTHHLQ